MPYVGLKTVRTTLDEFLWQLDREVDHTDGSVNLLCGRGIVAANTLRLTASVGSKPVSQLYFDSLKYDIQSVREGLASQVDPVGLALMTVGVESLEVKASHARAVPQTWAEAVLVRVHTLRRGVVANGLEVWYCPRKGSVVGSPYWRTFAKRSSPAIDRLAPGFYNIAPEGTRVEKYRIGGFGETEQDITLEVGN
ncbi:MAG TPA: hypothetical protein VF787_20575 [Thermoanaerobaculia bacterium]